MTTAIVLLPEELDALKGLPWPCYPLYIELRGRMDFATGRVGAIFGISWQALREALYQEPHRGIKQVYLHKEAVRRLARWLERRGLVRFQSNPASGRLIFKLPLAYTSSLAQKKADRETTGGNDRGPHRETPPKADRGKTAKADTHPRSVPSTTTLPNSTSVETLQWPASATPEEKATWKTMMQRAQLNRDAQNVLDELSAAILKGAIQKRTGYLARLIEKAKAGDFVLDRGKAIAAARERQASAPTQHAAPPPAKPSRSVAAEELRARMARGKK